mmetsp:Transcript_10636/g.10709  ORF Transcript_10636/g.10709 Transcript_10636/m.10709 type:complete len:513 (-) Transcript_10636:237-1775(-)
MFYQCRVAANRFMCNAHGLTYRRCSSDVQDLAFRKLAGSKALMIAADDELSKNISQQIWVKAQKAGCQLISYTVKSVFPSHKYINEGIELARRMGVTSVIAVGRGAVVDFGKAVRHGLETGSAFSKDYVPTSKTCTYPLIILPFTVSVSVHVPVFLSLHEEDDVLVLWPCQPAELVVQDLSILKQNPTYVPSIISSQLVCNLVDIYFSLSLHIAFSLFTQLRESQTESTDILLDRRTVEKAVKHTIQRQSHLWGEVKKHGNIVRGVHEEDLLETHCNFATSLAALRTALHLTPAPSPSPPPPSEVKQASSPSPSFLQESHQSPPLLPLNEWSSPLECALGVLVVQDVLQTLTKSPSKSQSLSRQISRGGTGRLSTSPSTWYSSKVLRSYLNSVDDIKNDNKIQTIEDCIQATALISLTETTQLLDVSVSELKALCDKTETDILAKSVDKTGALNLKHLNRQHVSSALQELIISTEADIEKISYKSIERSETDGTKLKLLKSEYYADFIDSIP